MKGILRRAGWAPRLRILPGQQPALGTCFPVSPSLPHHPHFCQPPFTWLCPGAFWDPLGVRRPGFSLGGSQRMPAAGVRGAEGVWGLVTRGLGNKDTKGSVSVRKLLGSLSPPSRPLFMLLPLPRIPFCLLPPPKFRPVSQIWLMSQETQRSQQHGIPEVSPCSLTSLTPHLSLGRMVQITHLAHIGRLPGGSDSLCRGRRTAQGVWGWGGLWALNLTSLTLLNANYYSLLPLSLSPLQVSLTWSRTPTTCKRPLTSREPTCTPCAVLQRRSVWPGKEMRMKRGQSPGVTQNLCSWQPGCLQAARPWPLHRWALPAPRQSGGEGNESDPAFLYTSLYEELNGI